jgi:hypothetical protein
MLACWLLFFGSFFLPATNVVENAGNPPGTPLSGWDACYSSVMLLTAQPLIAIAEPRALLILTFPFINAAMIVIPLVAYSDSDRALRCGALLLPLGIVPWLLPKLLTKDVFIGFYVWNISFFAMAACCIWLGVYDSWALRHKADFRN